MTCVFKGKVSCYETIAVKMLYLQSLLLIIGSSTPMVKNLANVLSEKQKNCASLKASLLWPQDLLLIKG